MATLVKVTGLVERPLELDFEALAALPGQVPDISSALPGRQGSGVRLTALLDAARPSPDVAYITLEAEGGDFSASIPLQPIRDRAIIAYRLGNDGLPAEKGGPVRFFIADIASIAVAGVDLCANVKQLSRIDLSRGPGLDLRSAAKAARRARRER